MSLNFALLGNPNCGKTTLFNQLTGSRAHVGNFPGVTVERKEGKYLKKSNINIIDLPGIYSLSPYSAEEIVSRDYILNKKPDLIINIVDATNFERNMYLTSQLVETGTSVIIALNMMDEAEAMGYNIDIEKLKLKLGLEVVPITASKGDGIDELMEKAVEASKEKKVFKPILNDSEINHKANKIRTVLNKNGKNITMFSAIKLLENDEAAIDMFKIDEPAMKLINSIINEGENGEEWDIKIADLRYKAIVDISNECIKKTRGVEELTITDKIDMILTNRFLAIPIFLTLMFLIFQITFGPAGNYLKDMMDRFVNGFLCENIENIVRASGAKDWLVSLASDGIISGLGMVLVFLPQILLLFLFLSIFEDTGYMARAAFIMDRLLRKFGLSGKSFVPMLMGFGCTVPAIMASRTLENEKDRRITIILTPFMSCGARLPVYVVFASAFFPLHKGAVIISLYVFGIIIALLSGLILKSTVLKSKKSAFIMELPAYRLPSAKTVFFHVWEKAKEFIKKAFTTLLAASVIIWFLQNFDLSFNIVSDNGESIFGALGKLIYPIFKPIGISDWRACAALLSGFAAKEAVVSTLGILYGGEGGLSNILPHHFNYISAYSYLVFVLLYMPCVAAFAAIRREMNSFKWTAFAIFYQCAAAWITSFLVYRIGIIIFY